MDHRLYFASAEVGEQRDVVTKEVRRRAYSIIAYAPTREMVNRWRSEFTFMISGEDLRSYPSDIEEIPSLEELKKRFGYTRNGREVKYIKWS